MIGKIQLLLFITTIFINGSPVYAQDSLRLEQLLELARINYPLVRQHQFADQQTEYSLAALNRTYLPQTALNVQASTQSDVTALPFTPSFPGITIDPLSRDQYRAVAEVNQMVYDGGLVAGQKSVQRSMNRLEHARINVEQQKLRERIRQTYLVLLMSEQQIAQIMLVEDDLQNGIQRLSAAVVNGTALRSQLSQLQAEYLRNRQRLTQLESTRRELIQTLAILCGTKLNTTTPAATPEVLGHPLTDSVIQRPELHVFQAQDSMLQAQSSLLLTRTIPRLSLFGQGGYGRPGLNMLDNSFDWFYLAGARISWNIGSLYTLSPEKKMNRTYRAINEVQQNTYMTNAKITVMQYRESILKCTELLQHDSDIVVLQEEIMRSSKAQLDQGVISANDYLRAVHDTDRARQTLTMHRLQLIQAILDHNDYCNNPD